MTFQSGTPARGYSRKSPLDYRYAMSGTHPKFVRRAARALVVLLALVTFAPSPALVFASSDSTPTSTDSVSMSAPTSASAAPVSVAAPDRVTSASHVAGTFGKAANDASDPRPMLTVALLDTLINPFDSFDLYRTIRHLEKALPQYRWRTMTVSAAEARETIERDRPDFLFAPSGFVVTVGVEQSISAFRIATRKTRLADKAEASVGSAFVVRTSDGFRTLEALRGRAAGASLPSGVESWLAAAGEIAETGADPERFFSRVDFRNNAYPDVISSLLAGKIDVAVLPACLLETLVSQGLADGSDLTVVHEKSGGLDCRHSTALYPDVSLLAMVWAPERAVRDVTVELLSLAPSDDGFEWLTNVSFASVRSLMYRLQVGPYAYLRDMSFSGIVSRWKKEILAALALLLLLVANEFRLQALVRRRTQELRDAALEQRKTAEEAAKARARLALFERRSVAQQMSGMIAHEVNGPIGAVRTYGVVLKMAAAALRKGRETGDLDAVRRYEAALEEAASGIEHEAVRIADIVARVRAHAKHEAGRREPCAIATIVEKSLRVLGTEYGPEDAACIDVTIEPGLTVSGDALELEILVLNLLRNALRVAGELPAGPSEPERRVSVRARRVETNTIRLEVANPCPNLSDRLVERLNRRTTELSVEICDESDGADTTAGSDARATPAQRGLGLGLSICRGIAESHCAALRFERRDDRVVAVVEFAALRAPSP